MIRSKKTPRWKKEQKKRKKQLNRAQMALGIGFLVFLISLVGINYLWQKAKNSIWNGKSRLAVVIVNNDLLKVDVAVPNQKTILSFKLKDNVLVKVPFEFGNYQLGKEYELGKLEDQGGFLLTRTSQDFLGLGIKGYQVGRFTNLSWLDKLRWWWFDKMISDQTTKINLVEEASFSTEAQVDGSVVYLGSQILIDDLVNEYLFDEEIVNEGLGIAVINISGKAGVAQTASRIISNLGGEIRMLDNGDLNEKSSILVSEKKWLNSKTVEKLARDFNITKLAIGDTSEFRAEIVLKIAKDYLKF